MKVWVFFLFPFISFSQVIPSAVLPRIQAAREKRNPLLIAEQFYGLPYTSDALSK